MGGGQSERSTPAKWLATLQASKPCLTEVLTGAVLETARGDYMVYLITMPEAGTARVEAGSGTGKCQIRPRIGQNATCTPSRQPECITDSPL
eukprot:4358777-Prymnesium_polylepis.1